MLSACPGPSPVTCVHRKVLHSRTSLLESYYRDIVRVVALPHPPNSSGWGQFQHHLLGCQVWSFLLFGGFIHGTWFDQYLKFIFKNCSIVEFWCSDSSIVLCSRVKFLHVLWKHTWNFSYLPLGKILHLILLNLLIVCYISLIFVFSKK